MIRVLSFTLALLASTLLAQERGDELSEYPEFVELDRELQILVTTWLSQDCEARQRIRLAVDLVAHRDRLEPVFWEAYRLGPMKKDIDRFTRELPKRYADRQNWLQESEPRY